MKTLLVALVLILLLLQVQLWRGEGSLGDIWSLDRDIVEQSTENATLEARNDALLQDVNGLKNGLDSIEERARNELGLIKKGETYYLILDHKDEP